VNRSLIALLGTLLAAGALPALAATNLTVPVSANAPSIDPRADDYTFDPAAIAQLSWNSTQSKSAAEQTTARITSDGKYLYVRFDATQNERIVNAQPVNGKGAGDLVYVDLWPSGASGTMYRYAASPDGSSSATASNGATAPAAQTAGASFPGGYTVTMKIPLAGLNASNWNVQFGRNVAANGQQMVWSHEGAQANPDDVASAGTMTLGSGAK